MPSRRTMAAVAVALVLVVAGGYLVFTELTEDDGPQTYEPPENLTYPEGLDIHEESYDRAKGFAIETEGDVVGAPATEEPTATFHICDEAFCFDVEYPTEAGASRAFYHIDEEGAVRMPHDEPVRDEPPDRPAQRILVVNADDVGLGVQMQLIANPDGARRQAGTVSETVAAYDARMVTLDDLEANTTYEVRYGWRDEQDDLHTQSLTFEAGNHSDDVWVFD